MNLPSVFVVKFFELDLLLVDKVFAVLIDIVSVLQKISGVLHSKILTLVYLNMLIPLFHSSLLFLLNFVKFSICHQLSFVLLSEFLLFFQLSLLLDFLQIFFIFYFL